ncbi:hypothetical protein J4233_04070 [Candidatus Pacearchaeota archaeon]|nr:hypothetical protein [Candidatus Pacearchaeota archaeon]
MNFKPTWLKTPLSIVLGFILGFLLNMFLANSFPDLFLIKASNQFEAFYSLNQLAFWTVNILTIILVYTIWSLFQKKR